MGIEAARAFVVLWLVGHGYQQHQADGIADVLWGESRFEPCVISPYGDEGIAQWRGSRRVNLHVDSATPQSSSVPLESQLVFLDKELRSRAEAKHFFSCHTRGEAKAVFRQRFEQSH